MKKSIVIGSLLLAAAAAASIIRNLDTNTVVKQSTLIVTGVVTEVKHRKEKCDTSTMVRFTIKETLKGNAAMATGTYVKSVYSFENGCPEISYRTYNSGKEFTAADVGTEAIFYYCFSTDYSHCCDDINARERVRALVKK